MSQQRLNFDGSRQQFGQGSFQSTRLNDVSGYALPSREQYLSRFLTHAGPFPSVGELAPQNNSDAYILPSHEQYLSRFPADAGQLPDVGGPAPQDSGFGGSYEHPTAPQNNDLGGSYDQYLFRFPAHADRSSNAVEAPPQIERLSGNGLNIWNGSLRPTPATARTANQPVEAQLGSVADHTPLYYSTNDHQHHVSAQAPQQSYSQVQEVQGRGGQHGWVYHYPGHFADVLLATDGRPGPYLSHAAAPNNVQYRHPNAYSPYTVTSNIQYEHPRVSSPHATSRQAAVRPRGPVGPSVEATRFSSQALNGPPSSAQPINLAQRTSGLREGRPTSTVDSLTPPQPSNGANHRALTEAHILAHRAAVAEAHIRGQHIAAKNRKPPAAKIQHCTVISAADPSHDPECPICQDSYDDNAHVAIKLLKTACDHVFGRNCLQQWVNSGMDNAHRCPNCRQSIAPALSLPARPSNTFAELQTRELQAREIQARQQRALLEMQRQGTGRGGSTPQPLPAIGPTPRTARPSLVAQQRTREILIAELNRRREARAAHETRRLQDRAQELARRQQARAQEGARTPGFPAREEARQESTTQAQAVTLRRPEALSASLQIAREIGRRAALEEIAAREQRSRRT
jgi:hypothetical protein